MRLNHKQIAAYTGGSFVVDPIDATELVCGISWDSREIEPGWLYVALAGERVDGHDFVAAALRAGARAALVCDALDRETRLLAREMGASVIEVPNTYSAVTDLAREWRGHLRGRIVALTGSTGKTTTKNLVRDVVRAGRSVVATKANQNNELGVPRTLLAADPETSCVVVEMGMRGSGQIAQLCEVVRPEWGIVTNVGESHIELLGSRENIARAKAELLEALPAGTGRAFLNAADDFAASIAARAGLSERAVACVAYDGSGHAAFSCTGHAHEVPAAVLASDNVDLPAGPRVWAEDVELDGEGRPRFTLCACGFAATSASEPAFAVERATCHLSLRGLHNVGNACAAAAVGRSLCIGLDAIAGALASSVPESGRQEVLAARGGFSIVNDAYNANPDSMRASLATFCALDVPGRRVAVLGDMGELGDFAPACHRGIGEVAAGLPLDLLICVGELSRGIAQGALDAGMDPARVMRADTVAEVLEELDVYLEKGDAVLVKASHFMGLTRVVEGLVD
ncbi:MULTISPECIES: UDP-N-acetylmuramoyl-tripeptide--D-alanyl-D-alanine ligase [unclassified Adlercreutzia]|uniref:UDP-N-acetylmuramoyl-tripeptide--D-alanyl-D- alanine ligase n=1 Tax=unclassified Adlercreutzia TaxID=2636013 RepID=UPI0013EB75BB|nr:MULTISPECIES: UDP-N-acetylmuramoyl-tripeptide--D-alanyl-D-alanine ligase [unclassified Adlercreutzia]